MSTADTATIGDGQVTLPLPAGASHTPLQGIDSTVGDITGVGFTCRYDLGLYSNPLTDVAGGRSETLTLSGRPARLISGSDGFEGLFVDRISQSSLGNSKLSIACTAKDSAAETVREMLRGTRIIGLP